MLLLSNLGLTCSLCNIIFVILTCFHWTNFFWRRIKKKQSGWWEEAGSKWKIFISHFAFRRQPTEFFFSAFFLTKGGYNKKYQVWTRFGSYCLLYTRYYFQILLILKILIWNYWRMIYRWRFQKDFDSIVIVKWFCHSRLQLKHTCDSIS